MSATLERSAAGCLLPGFEGTTCPAWLRTWLERGLGGVVLFARNIDDEEQLAALTTELRSAREEVIVAVDEEGGDVTRLEARTGSSYPGNAALGSVDDVELTAAVGSAIAADLARAGVNMNLAPVADVRASDENAIVGVRSFGSDPTLVARHVAAFVRGTQARGVAACAKHFPGHGETAEDSHVGEAVAAADRALLDARALPPFAAAIAAGVKAIMTAHVRVPALDDQPATLSRPIVAGLLRGELGFDGLVVSDALEMGAIGDATDAAPRALAAGVDALCLGADVGPDETEAAQSAIVDAVRRGSLAEDRVHEAAARLAAATRWASLEPAPHDRAIGAEAAARALRVDGAAVIAGDATVVELVPDPTIAAGPPGITASDVFGARRIALRRPQPPPDVPASEPLVVVLRDAHRDAWQQEVATALVQRRPDAVVVETGLPLWRPAAPAYVATFGAGRVNLEVAAMPAS